MICFKIWTHLVQSYVHAKPMNVDEASSRLIVNSFITAIGPFGRRYAHEALNNDENASSWLVLIHGTHLVQSHVHGDEAHEGHELIVEPCERRESLCQYGALCTATKLMNNFNANS